MSLLEQLIHFYAWDEASIAQLYLLSFMIGYAEAFLAIGCAVGV